MLRFKSLFLFTNYHVASSLLRYNSIKSLYLLLCFSGFCNAKLFLRLPIFEEKRQLINIICNMEGKTNLGEDGQAFIKLTLIDMICLKGCNGICNFLK